jgi:hypothetical protein
MIYEQEIVHTLYRKLLALYPQTFKEQLGESMERTFQDLWNEKRQTKKELFGFVFWTFTETAIGIFREHLLLISSGDIMQTILKTSGSSALISLLLILPFMIMEVVNRRNFNEDFPVVLFVGMWLNLFAISLILLPIVRGRRTGKHDMADPIPAQKNTLLTNPRLAAMISIALLLAPGILPLLNSLGWLSLDRLFTGPNPEQFYVFVVRVPSQFIALVLFSLPVAAGIIAGRPIVRTLQAGGSLFAHPIHLIIIILILSTVVIGLAGFIIDQWPCFIGVPNCD